ncbi:lamin tail domain-containing protein [Microbacterium sulfonylureivorans]|uniref:lamin tail domain-containing protein n=1 Tax=Microbacterium sulfonylureivorans TaxID=2486854 RepID=UPI000FDBDE20|nr:lamin tail domain-containing protein [Microbacterium sulfonylureivorans]
MPSPSPVRARLRALPAVLAALAVVVAPALVAAPASAADPTIVINEVESNGDDTDWVEVYNVGSAPVDLSGARFRDNDATREPWTLPAGSVVAPGGFLVIDQASGSNPVGFDFGLGNADEVHLYLPDGVTEIATYGWSIHSAVSYGRCPDGTGDFATTTVSTKGAANDCDLPVVLNEVESQPESGEDWVELVNVGSAEVDASGLMIRDSEDDHTFTVPAGTTIAPGAYLVVDTLGYGLGGGDSVRLFDGSTLLDAYSWTAHAAHTYGRCPDPRGDFAATTGATRGAQNLCAGVVIDEAWPGGADVRVLDAEDTFAGDLSGLDWEPSGSAPLGTLWAVQNGDGLLYRLVAGATGDWAPDTAGDWGAGKTLRYPDGAGAVDAEGVTVTGDDSAGGVYVSTERNNDASSISRPAVLRYDVSAAGSELTATHEWNLAPDFPGLGANAGLEGITWVPDGALTAGGFLDGVTGGAYDPADYPGHGGGLFFVGVEGTASVYAYALMADGAFARIATIATAFALVADVQYDADRGGLWVVCDEACDGRIAFSELDPGTGVFASTHVFERPSGAANYANEGFAVADDAVCADGAKPTFYADDADTDGFSLRQGTLPCEATGGPGEPTPTPSVTPTPSATPSASPSVTPTAAPTSSPTPSSTGAPGPAGDDELTDATRGAVDGPDSVAAGQTVTVYVGTQYAGQTVWVWLHSTPIPLGAQLVAADGTVTVTLPAGVEPGTHRIVVLDAGGEVIGWTEVTVTDALAVTGADGSAVALTVGGALALLIAGAALLLLRRRASRV